MKINIINIFFTALVFCSVAVLLLIAFVIFPKLSASPSEKIETIRGLDYQFQALSPGEWRQVEPGKDFTQNGLTISVSADNAALELKCPWGQKFQVTSQEVGVYSSGGYSPFQLSPDDIRGGVVFSTKNRKVVVIFEEYTTKWKFIETQP